MSLWVCRGKQIQKVMNNTFIRPNAGGSVMPLLMYYTPSTPIEEMDDVKISYNDILQITEIEARVIGTKCLKSNSTKKKSSSGKSIQFVTDKKNEIDDKKYVK